MNHNKIDEQQKDYLLKLPHIVLSKIVNYINDNLDRITLFLVCKYLYDLKEKYLSLFIEKKFDILSYQDHNYKSTLQQILVNSLFKKQTISLGINIFSDIDYGIIESSLNSKTIEPHVNKLWIGKTNINQDELFSFVESYPHIKSFSFSYFYENPVDFSSISNQITHISFYNLKQFSSDDSNNTLIHFSDTSELEYLNLSPFHNENSSKKIKVRCLPRKLKYLKLNNANFEIDSLPPNLERLYLYKWYELELLKPTFPATLKRIKINSDWVKHLKDLPLLTHLQLNEEDELLVKSCNEFPQSLTYLDFLSNRYHLPHGIIPTGVRYLKLGNCQYHLIDNETGNRFFDSEKHQFELLQLGKPIEYSIISDLHLPLKIGELHTSKIINSIPYGVEKLNLSGSDYDELPTLPDTVCELHLDEHFGSQKILKSIPPSVTKVSLKLIKAFGEFKISLPPTVHTLELSCHPDSHIILPNTLNTIYISSHEIRRLDSINLLVIKNGMVKKVGIISNSELKKFNKPFIDIEA